MWDVCWAAWKQMDPTATMQILKNGMEPMAKAGAFQDDQLPVTTMTIVDNDDDSNDKAGKNDDDNDKSEDNNAMTATAIPKERNDI